MLTARPYADPADFERLALLVSDAWAPWSPDTYFHLGDLCWRARDPHWAESLTVFEESGAVAAFAEITPDGSFELQVCGSRFGSADRAELYGRCERIAAQRATVARSGAELRTWAAEDDRSLAGWLESQGYRRTGGYALQWFRALDAPLPHAGLPAGFAVRSIEPGELAPRVDVHRRAWNPSRTTDPMYRRLMATPAYDPALDIVAVDAGGRMAACCNGWLDEASGVGQFEPVGTDPEFRRLGLGRAIVMYGCHVMRERGAHTAYICSFSANAPANRLYESCGFEVRRRDYRYARQNAGGVIDATHGP